MRRLGLTYVKADTVPPSLLKELTFTQFSREGSKQFSIYHKDGDCIGIPKRLTGGNNEYGHEITSVTKRPNPDHPSVRDPAGQALFMDSLHTALLQDGMVSAEAPTGSGKTVVSLEVSARLGRTTLILVHLDKLKDQWIEEIQDKLGVPREKIGVVQEDKCEYINKDYVVGVVHTICRREHEEEFYKHFGFVIYDEVHRMSTEFFSIAASKFPAAYQVGLSATHREDALKGVTEAFLGPVSVVSTAEALPITVYVVNNSLSRVWGDTDEARIMCIANDTKRNARIAQLAKRMGDAGRQVLIVSYSVKHLQKIRNLMIQAGVPNKDIGLFCSTYYVEEGTKITSKKKRTTKKENEAAQRCQYVLAPYNIITEGIDIPTLSGGIDATPRAKSKQVIGRTRRPLPGKKNPIWFTFRDTNCNVSERLYSARLRDYAKAGAEVRQAQIR